MLLKTVDDDIQYDIDWSDALRTGDTIVDSDWDVPAGVTSGSNTFTTTTTSIFIAGGTHGTTYEVENTITTDQGETIKRSLRIKALTNIEAT